jgi:light-regulated signal transduction histidine kinase (bacteriophytochrome)
MQYLQNMQIRATMTLSIVVDGKLWGMISFHHRKTKTPAPKLREVLTSFAEIFTMKLKMLRQQERLQLVARVDALKDDLLGQIETDKTLVDALPKLGPLVQEVMGACGTVVVVGSKIVSTGQVPEQALIERLQSEAKTEPHNLIAIDNLAERFPELAPSFNGCAGALVVAIGPDRAFCIFRTEQVQNVLWAGNPEKMIGQYEGKARLEPRGSFSAYLQEVENSCNAWSELDQYFARSIWALVNAAERQALMKTLNRQQKLMIDELNHRVRNILSLVRSVSKQARRRYGSLSSYAKSLESRIMALAAAHDIASGSEISNVELKSLITQELTPYLKDEAADVTGPDTYLRADIAPIFALVIHELVTNAAKYGALSDGVGTVSVVLTEKSDGIEVFWQERDGPQVEEPQERGFGTVLIESAVQYELGGEAKLEFRPSGVEARLFLPNATMEMDAALTAGAVRVGTPIVLQTAEPFVAGDNAGHVLIVEDNFIIAQEMHDQIEDFGFSEIEICSNCKDALAFLESETPVLAILDVNLGMDQTSLPIAEELVRMDVPFLFVTGYGDTLEMPETLDHVTRLTKPVSDPGLNAAIGKLLAPSGRSG